MVAVAVAVVSVALVGCASAPSATHATPSPSSIAPLVASPLPSSVAAELQAALTKYVQTHHTPSASGAVIIPGKGTWAGAVGLADTTKARAATTDTAYAIASITKTFVAALTLQLVRDGHLGLDDAAGRWLDASAAAKANGATIRQLLGHRSGVASYTETDAINTPDKIWSIQELLGLIGAPLFAAGAQAHYSNSDYLLLGLIDEHAGGAPLSTQLRERLFKPNGLDRTFFSAAEQVAPPLAHGYGLAAPLAGDRYDNSGYLPNRSQATQAWSAGSMASTPSDVARFLYAVCRGTVAGDKLRRQMLPPGGTDSYGLGLEQHSFPGAGWVTGHVGLIPGYVALGFFRPDNCVVAVVITNTDVEDLNLAMEDMFGVAARG